jgi:hypothetical protein
MGASKVTVDHDEIRAWVEERNGSPARVKRTGAKDDPGILRIDFPGFSGEDSLEAIEWQDWFDAFEENGLAFVYQEETADGGESRFNKLISRENAPVTASKSGGSSSKGSAKKSGTKQTSAKHSTR